MNAEGGLSIELQLDNGRVTDVSLRSYRPLQMVKVLHGKPISEGLKLLGLIYRVCGIAHRYAGLSAWRQATSSIAEPELLQAQQLLLDLETIREHLWQVLVVWPELLGEKPDATQNLSLLSVLTHEIEKALFSGTPSMAPEAMLDIDEERCLQLSRQLITMLEQKVCTMPISQWRNLSSPQQIFSWAEQQQVPAQRMFHYLVQQQWQELGREKVAVESLPELQQSALSSLFVAENREQFISKPTWQGKCCETTAFSRQVDRPLIKALHKLYGDGLLTRMTAKLVELVDLVNSFGSELSKLCARTISSDKWTITSTQSGQGLAMIEAARGRLIHWMKLDGGIIADYAILAPTEWNFHPQGVAVQGLKSLRPRDEAELKQQTALWINAIDPCVGYKLIITS